MKYGKAERQRHIDSYFEMSGRNMFVPSEFVDWLQDHPEHEAYSAFYSMTDAVAAREHRIDMARRMASGLRIVVQVEAGAGKSTVVQVTTREYPAFISPVAARKTGGGYEPMNPDSEEHLLELRRQGAMALRSWLARYRGAFEAFGTDLSTLDAIAGSAEPQAITSQNVA